MTLDRFELADDCVLFSYAGIPMVGNLRTGGLIGLTSEGEALCQKMSEGGVVSSEIPEDCRVLVEHMARGGYLKLPEGCVRDVARVSSAYLHVTQRCNLSCAFCYSDGKDRNSLADPTLEELCRAIDLLVSLGVQRLVISGGEPFLRRDLPQLARHAREREIGQVVILTNGLLVTRECVEPLSGLVDTIAVAFDGCSADDAAFLRGRQLYDQVVDAIGVLKGAGIGAHILPTVHAENLLDIPRYRELASSLGASVSFSMLTANSAQMGELLMDDDQLALLAQLSVDGDLSVDDDLMSPSRKLRGVRRSCGAGVRTISVAADGSVYPCHMLHFKELTMGNAFVDDADSITSGAVARTCADLTVDSIEGCSSCEIRYICGGGCRAQSYLETGNLFSKSLYCSLYRNLYDRTRSQA